MREPSTLTDSFARRVVALVMRFPALILVVTLVVAALAAMSARQLKVDSRLKVLLPQDSPSVVHLDRMTAEVGNHEDLYIVVRSPSRADNLAFAERLADAVAKDPEIRFVVFRRDTRFFDDNVLLYAPLADLLDIRRRVIERIQAEIRRELSPLGEYDKPVEDLDLSEDELRSRYDLPDRPSDYFETDEGRVVVIVARPTGSSTDFTSAAALLERIDGQVAGLNPTAQHPALTVEYAGGYSKNTRLTRRLQADVASGTAAALIILALTLVIYFRGIRAVPLILTPLVAAALVALAFAFYWVSYLNLVGAFMFAVLLGIGIDFGIHVLARYRDERGEGLDVREALEATLATAGVSTGAGAASTALAFALLGIAEFKGISQFGVIASVGIVLAFFCAVLVLPAMMVLFERVWPWRPPKRAAKHERRSLPRRFPWVSALACALVLAGAAASLARVGDVAFETDLRTFEVELETTDAERARALQYQEAVGEHESSTPAIAIADSPEETAFVFRHLRALVDLSEEQFEALVAGEPVPPKPRAAAKPEAKAADQKTAPAPAKDDGWGDDDDDDDAKAAEPVDATAEGAAKPEGSTPDEGAAAAKPASGGDDDE
ncbi:MAG: MMPL family transporter, partial [Myxococcales bacterium]|nr:MMPL family transporter [Myxococcales bacterium]